MTKIDPWTGGVRANGTPEYIDGYDNSRYTVTGKTRVDTARVETVPTPGVLSSGTVDATQVMLSWTAPTASATAPVTAQTIYIRTGGAAGPIVRTIPLGATNRTHTAGGTTPLTTGTAYTFTITATNRIGESAPSNAVTATPTEPASGVPTIGTLSTTGKTATTVDLAWTAPTAPTAAPVTSQKVYVRSGSPATLDRTLTQAATDRSVTVGSATPLVTGRAYTFNVTALNSVGESAESNTVTVTPRAAQAGNHLLGFYPGIANTDENVKNIIGQFPQIASSYWQRGSYQGLSTVENTRMANGIHSSHLIASVKDTATYPTQAKDAVVNTIAGNPPFWLTDYIERSEAVAVRYPDLTMTLYPFGEVEVGFNQNYQGIINNAAGGKRDQLSLWDHYDRDTIAILVAYGQFINEFFNLCDELAPHCKRAYFMGGSASGGTVGTLGANNANRNKIFDQITNPPSHVTCDPYNNAVDLTETATDTWRHDIELYTSPTGAHNAHWVRWGRPQPALGETGISKRHPATGQARYTEQQRATWIRTINEAMEYWNVAYCLYFNSQGPNGVQEITSTPTSPAVSAFNAELTEAKAA